MAKAKVKLQHLTVLLLKDSIIDFADSLKDASLLTSHDLKAGLSFSGELYLQEPTTKPPKWLEFLAQGVQNPLQALLNTTNSAVLFVESSGTRFAITYGFGRSLLKADSFERDFGLKVVLNTVDPATLRSIDIHAVEELTLHTRRQVSRGSPLGTFGINVTQDILRAVMGKPGNESLATLVAGSDALSINTRVEFTGLGNKCDELIAAYKSNAYKANFGFIDDLRPVRDPALITKLEGLLLNAIKAKDTENVHLAPPELLDWEGVEDFCYTTDDTQTFYDLDIDDYLSTVGDLKSLTLSTLKKDHRVGVRFVGYAAATPKWPIYRTLVYEVEDGALCYILSNGEWFEVAVTLSKRVYNAMKKLDKSTLLLDDAKADESEGKYNARIAKKSGLGPLDQQLVKAAGCATSVEICDLFSKDRQFIHVKRKTRSATLSHLFSQGTISAEAFYTDEDFRTEMRAKLTKYPDLAKLVPAERPDPCKYEVVYAIIAKKPKKTWPHSLPFFSQLNLMHASDRLRRLGYKVSLLRIGGV